MSSAKISKLQSIASGDTKGYASGSDSENKDEKIEVKQRIIKHRTDELKVQVLEERKHMLHRPDMYIGSVRRIKSSGRIWVLENGKFRCREAFVVEGLLRVFMEAISNAIDNIWRSKQFKIPCTKIRVEINRETGVLSVWNDGKPISCEKHETLTDEYNPEVMFGRFRSGTNYDDSEERKTVGRNGEGIKIALVFARWFKINLFNRKEGLLYEQKWIDNMETKQKPVIDRDKKHFPEGKDAGYTLVQWLPDYKRFDFPSGIDDDMLAVMEKAIYDYALMAAQSGVQIFYNDKLVPVHDFKSYVNLYYDDPPEELIEFKSEDCRVIAAPKADPLFKGDLMHVAFVNGLLTAKGGIHVDAWDEAIFRPIVNKINGVSGGKKKAPKKTAGKKKPVEKKKPLIDITHVRKYFSLFVIAEVDNPTFTGQNKDYYNSPEVNVKVKPSDIKKLMKWEFVQRIEDSIKLKEFASLKDAGKKKRNSLNIPQLEDANFAGDPKRGKECILIFCEGDSAASYASIGMQFGLDGAVGQDTTGIFALRGKCFFPGTEILLWDGSIKQAKNIVIGDVLIDDLGLPCSVESLTSGEDDMYEIYNEEAAVSYKVNSQHTLTVKSGSNVLDISLQEFIKSPKMNDLRGFRYIKINDKMPLKLRERMRKYLDKQPISEYEIKIRKLNRGLYCGFSVSGSHRFLLGDFSVAHNCLNVRNAGITKILKNKEIIGSIKALGLEYGVDYTELKQRNKLRYGKVYVVSDSDSDGCLAENSLVNLPSGLSVQIKQLDHLPRCLSWYEQQDGLKSAQITKFMNKGSKKVVEILFEDGRTITLTPDHKLCSSNGKWIEAQNAKGLSFKMDGIYPSLDYDKAVSSWKLKVGNMNFTMNSKIEIDRTLAFCRILGLLISDGHFDTTYTEAYTGCAADLNSILDDASKFIDRSLIKVYEPTSDKQMWVIRFRTAFGKACTSIDGVLGGKRVNQPAALPGFIKDIKCPLIIIREFLAGFFGGDGVAPCLTKYKTRCSKERRYQFSGLGLVQSKESEHVESLMDMMNQIGGLLELFNISSTVRAQPRKTRIDKTECVKLFVNPDSYLAFANEIGFRHCVHKARRMSCVQSYYRLYETVRFQRRQMAKRGAELRLEGYTIPEAREQSIKEFKLKNIIMHPASLIIDGNLKYDNRGNKVFKNLCRSGFYDPVAYLRKINGLHNFISEDDIKADTNRQGSSHYGIGQNDEYVKPMILEAISVKELESLVPVYDLTVEDPTHCFVADGIIAHNCHITGLMVNFIHTLFPSLLTANDFFHFLRVPTVKINMKQEQLSFLFYYASQQYLLNHAVPKKAIRYFKGLGTFKPKDVAEDFGRYPVALIMTDKAEELLPKVFGKDDSNFRKEWLLQYQDKIMERKTPDFEVEQLPIEKFLDDEMRVYSIESCLRGIPRVIDGLKESTCKVLNTAIDEPLNYNSEEMKVVQLAGAVAKEMGYHHGEQNIPSIIIKMAQSFPGSNNIPLFYASGHFGSRQGGKKDLAVGDDASAGRYIFTKLEMLTRLIFRPEDDEYLPNNVQDGKIVEKKYYMPIIPMVLVNGASGIGTAHSSTVPQYNPFELMDWIDTWLEKQGKIKTESNGLTFYETPPLIPYYRGFTGKIEVDGPKITIKGVIEQTNKNEWTITELPLGRLNVSIKKYRTKLEKFKDEKKIKSFTSQKHDLNKPFFTITADPDGIIPNLQNMKLIDTISTTNMVLFNEESKLIKFESVEAILEYYCRRRYDFYIIRMNGMLQALRLDLKWASNKIRFIRLVHEKKLEIRDRDERELDDEMVFLKFDKQPKAKRGKQQTKAKPDQEEDIDDEKESKSPESFDYLLNMKIACLNIASKAYKELEKKKLAIEEQIKDIESTTVEALWRREMKELKEAHTKWEKRMVDDAKVPKRGKKSKTRSAARHG
jgi:DNA gyrase/topoisomerase IV subunit B